jgi:predicted PurR-regulated permease PerM
MQQNNWRQPIRYAVAILILLAIIWLIITFQPLISSLILAALLAYVLHPLVNLITRNSRLSHSTAVNMVYLLFLLSLVAIPAVLTPIIIGQVRGLAPDIERIGEQIRSFTERPMVIGNISLSFDILLNDLETIATQTITDIASNLGNVLADISTNFLWILIMLVSIYYLLKESHTLIDWGVGLISPRYQHHAERLLADINAIWGSFLRGQLLLMLIIGGLSWLGALIVGLPGAFVVGLIAGILDIIPSLGPVIAAIVAATIALFEGSTYLPVSKLFFVLIVLAVFILIQQVENIWIRPFLMGRRLRLHPALVFVGVLSSLALFGILVTLIIIPLMATIGVLGRYIRCMLQGVDPYPIDSSEASIPEAMGIIEKSPVKDYKFSIRE